jgi:hypothetical protein
MTPGAALAEVHPAGLVTTAQTPLAAAGDLNTKVALSSAPLSLEGVSPVTTAARTRPEMSAAVSPVDFAPSARQRATGEERKLAAFSGNSQAETAPKDDAFGIPYALVLVLVALIGLVPVSRRHR